MHKNLLWQAFLVLVLVITLAYTGVAAYRYYNYARLKRATLPTTLKWQIRERSSDEYLVEGDYTFSVNNKNYSGATLRSQDPYLNPYAAERGIDMLSSQSWKIWFDPSNPEYSSLQKNFPLKEVISAICLWALLFYFLWLGFYVTRFKSN